MNIGQPAHKSNSGVDPGGSVSKSNQKISGFKQIFNDLNQNTKQKQNPDLKDKTEKIFDLLTLSSQEQQQKLNEMSQEKLKELRNYMKMSSDKFLENLKNAGFDHNLTGDVKQMLDNRWQKLKQLMTAIMKEGSFAGSRLRHLNKSELDYSSSDINSLLNDDKKGRLSKLKTMTPEELKVLREQLQQYKDIISSAKKEELLQLENEINRLLEDVNGILQSFYEKILDFADRGQEEEAAADRIFKKLKEFPLNKLKDLSREIDNLKESEEIIDLLLNKTDVSLDNGDFVIKSEKIAEQLRDQNNLEPEMKRILIKVLESSTPAEEKLQKLDRLSGEQLEYLQHLLENNTPGDIVSLDELNKNQISFLRQGFYQLEQMISELLSARTGSMDKELLQQYLDQESALNLNRSRSIGNENSNKGNLDNSDTSLKGLFNDNKVSDDHDFPIAKNKTGTRNLQFSGSKIAGAAADFDTFSGSSDDFLHQGQPDLMQMGWQNSGHEIIFNQQNKMPGVVDQIMKQFELYHNPGTDKIEIQLEPEFLGKVKLDLALKGGKLEAKFQVESHFVKHHLEQNISGLKNSLLKHGIDIERLTIESNNRESNMEYDSQSRDHSGGNKNQQQQQNQYHPSYYFREYIQQEEEISPEKAAELRLNLAPWMLNNYLRMNILA